ncbi:MAG: COX15/CtaA family protein [Candidatus Omnitrophica bacterium]|nr:COX15/CtaA family protein [Candidatus Omnitrophota bacterium]
MFASDRSALRLHRYAMLTASATFLLLIAGGLVTSTDSGLAVPDWPLSYGMLFPPMVGGIFYEHGHRMIAGVVGILIGVLAVWTRKTEKRIWVRRLAAFAFAAVLAQALLGGLTVLLLLPPQISIAHACLGQTVFCLVVGLAWCTHPGWSATLATARPIGGSFFLRFLAMAVAILAATQLFLGAVIRHTGIAVVPHMIVALCLLMTSVICLWQVLKRRASLPSVPSHAWRVVLLLGVQLTLGVMVFLNRSSVGLRTAHVAVGALILSQAVLLAWEVWRRAGSPSCETDECVSRAY